MMTPDQQVSILKGEIRRFEQYLRGLSHADWDQPSACGEWTVADVIAHILTFSTRYPARIAEALAADATSQDRLPRRSRDRVDAAPVAQSAMALRRELGDDLLECFRDANRSVEAAFDKVRPSDWSRLCFRPRGAETLLNVLNTFIVEMAVHRWDVESPTNAVASLAREPLPLMVERYAHRPRWWELVLPPRHPPLPVRFRFDITDMDVSGTDFVISADGEKYTEVAGDLAATVQLRCDAETFILVAYGRIPPAAAMARGRLTVSGSQEWADMFVARFVGG